MTKPMPHLVERIKAIREALDKTQEELAILAGVSARTIQRLEEGKPPSRDTLRAIAAALDMTVDALCEPPFEMPKDGVPVITSGADLVAMLNKAFAFGHGTLGDVCADDARAIGAFLDACSEWMDLLDELSPSGRMDVGRSLQEMLDDLACRGWMVFGQREMRTVRLTDGTTDTWPVVALQVARGDDAGVVVHPELQRFAEAVQAAMNEESAEA